MVKARIMTALILGLVMLAVLVPGSQVAAAPAQPVNVSPDNATLEIGPMHQFFTASYPDDADPYNDPLNAQWQMVRSATEPSLDAYKTPLWDSGLVTTAANPSYSFPIGLLEYGQTYWWRVRIQDVTGLWSPWSVHTWFKVIANSPPNEPSNQAPADGATAVSVTPILQASDFTDPDVTAFAALDEVLATSQWQVTTTAGSYGSPVYSATVSGLATSLVVPAAKLSANTKYYWRVRYQDSYGNWSAWSRDTSFTTKAISAPVAAFTADKDSVVGGQDLVIFTDNSTPAAEIDMWKWEFGDGDSENWTALTRPSSGQVSHQYSSAAGGTKTVRLTVYNSAADTGVHKTMSIAVHTKPEAGFTISPAAAKAGADITITDTSTPPQDITNWEWQIDGVTVATWASPAARQAAGNEIKHSFDDGGTHTVSLTVTGALGESFYTKEIKVTGGGGFHFSLWMIAVAIAIVAVVTGAVYLIRGRKAK